MGNRKPGLPKRETRYTSRLESRRPDLLKTAKRLGLNIMNGVGTAIAWITGVALRCCTGSKETRL